jgi:hypothetical protein
LQLHILIGAGVGEERDKPKARHGGPRSRGIQEAELSDGQRADVLVHLLLDLVQHGLAFLAVALCSLLAVPRVDLRVLDERVVPLAIDERLDARRRIAERATALDRGLDSMTATVLDLAATDASPAAAP